MSSESDSLSSIGLRLSKTLRRFLLPLLVLCLIAAAIFPEPGLILRDATIAIPNGKTGRAPLLLLAVLLYCAAMTIQWNHVKKTLRSPRRMLLGLFTAWIGPAIVIGAAGALLRQATFGQLGPELFVGLALVASMPVANSSVGWTHSAGGNVALSLGLIILTITLCPFFTPQMLRLMGMFLTESETDKLLLVVKQFSGTTFIGWVILPSIVGGITAWLVGTKQIEQLRGWIQLISLTVILMLNYMNASLAMPQIVREQPIGFVCVAIAAGAVLNLVGIFFVLIISRRIDIESRRALLFSSSMKHTGLALVVAGEVLPESVGVILIILVTSLTQHTVAAIVDRFFGAKVSDVALPKDPATGT